MERGMLTTALAVLVLLGSSGTTAAASDGSVSQSVDVEVVPGDADAATVDPGGAAAVPEDLLTIEVEPDLTLGAVVAGASIERPFEIRVSNTTSSGWEVTVAADDLVGTGDACEPPPRAPEGCEGLAAPRVIDRSNLVLRGGTFGGIVVGHEGTLGERPLLLMTGAVAPQQPLLVLTGPTPSLELTVPPGTPSGRYRTTLTYTIMSTGEGAP
jgi:hypothetical protein